MLAVSPVASLFLFVISHLRDEIDGHINRGRALREARNYADALASIELALSTAASAGLPPPSQAQLESNIMFEKAQVLVCLERIDDAINVYSASFELLTTLPNANKMVSDPRKQGQPAHALDLISCPEQFAAIPNALL